MNPQNRGAELLALTSIPAPYRIPTLNWLAEHIEGDFCVAFIAPGDPRRNWRPNPDMMKFKWHFLSKSLLRTSHLEALFAASRVLVLLQRSDPHGVVCGGYDSLAAWATFLWCKARGRRFALWVESNARDQRTASRLKNVLKRLMVSRADGIGASGTASAAYMRELGGNAERVFLAPFSGDNAFFARESSMVDAVREKSKRRWAPHLVLYSGRLVAAKGVQVLLKVFRSVSQTFRDVGLLIVGQGPERESMQNFCRRHALDRVYFVGPQPYERMPFFYALADLLVLPTFSDPWGFVVNEAFACGVPAIVSRVAGACDDLIVEGETGFAVEPGNADELASRMSCVLENPELRAHMSANCRSKVEPYTARACAEGLLAAVRGGQ